MLQQANHYSDQAPANQERSARQASCLFKNHDGHHEHCHWGGELKIFNAPSNQSDEE